MPRRRRTIEDDVEALELRHARATARVDGEIPPDVLAAMNARLDEEAAAWLDDFDSAVQRALNPSATESSSA